MGGAVKKRHACVCRGTGGEWRKVQRSRCLERADEAAEARYGACLSCGGSIELHESQESPNASEWRRVTSLDDVHIAAVRYVLASAGAIARKARRMSTGTATRLGPFCGFCPVRSASVLTILFFKNPQNRSSAHVAP
jgi:hypothetical protein